MADRYRSIRNISFGTLFFIVLISYQNCTSEPQSGQSKNMASSIADESGFAYDTTFDHLAYMSCSGPKTETSSTLFTFRLGAFNNAGIRLKDTFLKATSKMTEMDKIAALKSSTMNSDTQVILGLRSRSNYTTGFGHTRGALTENIDYSRVFLPLTEDSVLNKLVSFGSNKRLNFLQGEDVVGSRLLGDLHFSSNETLMNALRGQLDTAGNDLLYLTSTYAYSSANAEVSRSPSDFLAPGAPAIHNSLYGQGFSMSFGSPDQARFKPDPAREIYFQHKRVLTSVTERSLQDGKITASPWKCPIDYQFKIFRFEDAVVKNSNGTYQNNCEPVPDDVSTPDKKAIFARLRHVLLPELWAINLDKKCIVPKLTKDGAASCYDPGPTNVTLFLSNINYDLTNRNCVKELEHFNPDGTTTADVLCGHFFSLCFVE